MKLNSKDTFWKGTITEYLKEGEERQRQFRESPDRVKFVTKLEIVYDFLEKHKKWAYSMDELMEALEMARGTVKHIVKWLKQFGAVEEKLMSGVKYYIFSTETNVSESYKTRLVKKYREWRIDPAEIAKDMERKGLGHVSENSAA